MNYEFWKLETISFIELNVWKNLRNADGACGTHHTSQAWSNLEVIVERVEKRSKSPLFSFTNSALSILMTALVLPTLNKTYIYLNQIHYRERIFIIEELYVHSDFVSSSARSSLTDSGYWLLVSSSLLALLFSAYTFHYWAFTFRPLTNYIYEIPFENLFLSYKTRCCMNNTFVLVFIFHTDWINRRFVRVDLWQCTLNVETEKFR